MILLSALRQNKILRGMYAQVQLLYNPATDNFFVDDQVLALDKAL